MMRISLVALVFAIATTPVAMRGDDPKPRGDQTPKSSGAAAPNVESTGATATPDQLKGVLQEALKLIQSLAQDASKSEREFQLPTPGMFAMQMSKELQCESLTAIGRAQAALGDKAATRTTLQEAAGMAGEILTIGQPTRRAELYADIAAVQNEFGEKAEAQLTLRQALQAASMVKAGVKLPFPTPAGLDEFDYEPVAKKSAVLNKIAGIQAASGDAAASQETLDQAVEAAKSLEQPAMQVRALLAIAEGRPVAAVKTIWNAALDLALAISDEYARIKAVESVLRSQIKADLPDDALASVADRLKGDFQNYGLWVVADAIAESDHSVPGPTMDRLKQLAAKADFDRPSKKIKVFERIAAAQARLGDHDGAYRTSGEPHPLNNIQDFRATQARVNVMKSIAEAQIKAKQLTAAKNTIQAALEIFAPLGDEDAEAYFPLASLGELQAKAGDLAGAEETAKSLSFSPSRVGILVEVAVAYARLGRRDDARKVLQRATTEADHAPRDALWRATVQSIGIPEGLDPMAPVLETIAAAHARVGDPDAALQTVGRIRSSRFGQFTRKQAIEQIVSARLDAGDIPGALKAVEFIPDSETMLLDDKAGLLERIAKSQAEKHDPAAVLGWARKQEVPNRKLQVLRGLADGITERYAPKKKQEKSTTTRATAKSAN